MTVLASAVAVVACFGQEKEARTVSAFSAIEVSKGANISLIQGDKVGLEVVTDGCPTSDVETVVENGVLEVTMKKKTAGSAVQVMVYFKDIERVKVRRGASVETSCSFAHKGTFTLEVGAQCEAKLDIDCDELVVDGSTCVIELEGSAKRQKVNVTGTVGQSTYDAEELVSEDIEIKAVNTDAEVNFSNSLSAEAVSATVRYKGDGGKVSKSEKAGGRVVAF